MREHVLFVHGAGTSPLMWASISSDVLGGRSAIAPSNLGYPPNPPLPRGSRISLEDEADHLLRAMPDDGCPIHVVAHSYGATVALVLAGLHPLAGRLASMFLVEPVLFGALVRDDDSEVGTYDPQAVATARERFEVDTFFLDDEKGGTAEWLEGFIDYWNRPGTWSNMPEIIREQLLSVGWKMYQEVRLCFAADRPFRDWSLAVPTTLAFGERTTVHSRAMTRALERTHRASNVTVLEMRGAGHMAPITHPHLVAEALGRHLARSSAGPR